VQGTATALPEDWNEQLNAHISNMVLAAAKVSACAAARACCCDLPPPPPARARLTQPLLTR